MRIHTELRFEAVVVGPGSPGFLRVGLGRRRGFVADGIHEVPVTRIPASLHAPNSRFIAVTVEGVVARVEEDSVGRPKLELEESVRRVLNRWDPIGSADEVADEYDCYIPQILGLLRSGADEAAIARHLFTIEEGQMDMGYGSWKDRLPVGSELRRLAIPSPSAVRPVE
jgi:hypothetical protein